jgi:hypothetical protein
MSALPLLRVAEEDPVPVPLAPQPPIPVTVTTDEHVHVSRDPVNVPWLFAGNIIFTLDSDDSFQDPGITFTTLNAPFVVSLTLDKLCVVTAVNNNLAQTNVPYSYTLNLKSGTRSFRFDPTVENDSPPPPPVGD